MSDPRQPHVAPGESLPSFANRAYDSLGIGDLYDDDAWVQRANDQGLPSASAVPDRPPYDVDPLRDPFTDDIYVEPYQPEPFPVGWDFLAAVVIAGACIAFGWWAFLR